MLRLFAAQVVSDLRRCSPVVVCSVTRGKVRDGVCPFSSHRTPAHHLHTGNTVRKESTQTKTEPREKTIDLDKWKHVMRSQATVEKQQIDDDGDDDDEEEDEEAKAEDATIRGAGGAGPTLEATRELVTMWRYAGKMVPEGITDEELQILSDLTTKSGKKKYLKFLAIREGHKKSRKKKQQQKTAEKVAMLEKGELETEGDNQREKETKCTFLMKFWDSSLNKLLAWRSAQAMLFGQPLIFDMSYESNMSRREVENTVTQLLQLEGANRRAVDPFHLHFCNLQPDSAYMRELLKRYGAETWDQLLITTTDRQHVDLFPRERLVYLTADSPNVLRSFDRSKVYIIGALVDRSIQSGLSLANAKRLKLTTARLPLNEFLHWDMGAKNLTLDQMLSIMQTLKETGNWEEALQFVPKRKHVGFVQPQTPRQFFNKDKRLTQARPGQVSDRSLRSGDSNSGRTFRSGDQRMNSFKGKMEGKTTASRQKMWWEAE
ncbi:tRNA methyltransferase 10 homolog C [Genypterus blacodes]|uniref:tRNA methyltransferase 10 homolog C n=1 Tax=Genypterus blacodes TaxID=154954 RepID=UPI003F774EAE